MIDNRVFQMPSKFHHLLFCLLASSSTMASSSSIGSKKRTRPSLAQLMSDSDVRALLRCGTKTGMCTALETLHRAGLLCTNDTNRKLRRTLQDATVQQGRSVTPYGTVIQQVDLGIPGIGPLGVLQPSRLSSVHQYSQECVRRSHEIVHRAWAGIDDDIVYGRVVSREPIPTRKG